MAEYEPDILEAANQWQAYVQSVDDWQSLVTGVEPKPTGCGPVYELPNPIRRPGEGFAIADMRNLSAAEPHYHPDGNWEFYIAFSGTATVIVGGFENRMKKGDALVIPPNTAHFAIPDEKFVIAVISRPPFDPANYIKLEDSNPEVGYDHEQFLTLNSRRAQSGSSDLPTIDDITGSLEQFTVDDSKDAIRRAYAKKYSR